MKFCINGILAPLAAVLVMFPSQDAMAQKKSKNTRHILDGTQVYVNPGAKAAPVEEKLKKNSAPALEYSPTKTIYLYPEGQNVDQGIVENGVKVTEGPLESNGVTTPEVAMRWGFVADVSDSARIDIYLPEKPNGLMVISCPGGAYQNLSAWNEGTYLAKWMNDRGIACAVAKYRLPHGNSRVPLQDLQNAFRYCRYHAEEWGVKQIGVIGFSAGGHLASTVETMYVDSITRPDFAVLIYPVISMDDAITHKGTKDALIGAPVYTADRAKVPYGEWYENKKDIDEKVVRYSSYVNITPDTPPTFIALSSDDKAVPAENSLRFYRNLVRFKVNSELHIYPFGGHGWGFTDPAIGLEAGKYKDYLGSCRPEFSAALERWMKQQLAKDAPKKSSEVRREPFSLKPDKTVLLYPEGQNVDKGIEGVILGPGESNGYTEPEIINAKRGERSMTGDSVRFDVYLAQKPNGKMVIICPGGCYSFTADLTEGRMAAEWLNSQGVSAVVLNYRLPNGHWNVPLTDVQNTLRYCRHYAKEWGIEKIGIMGLSAGGHLAATASTQYVDELTRPDFSVLVYPVISTEDGVGHRQSVENLIGKPSFWNDRKGTAEAGKSSYCEWKDRQETYRQLKERYSLDRQVSSDTPPTFIIFSSNDNGVSVENELRYYRALLKANVKCEMHAFPQGGHGYGFIQEKYMADPLGECRADFLNAIARFLKEI